MSLLTTKKEKVEFSTLLLVYTFVKFVELCEQEIPGFHIRKHGETSDAPDVSGASPTLSKPEGIPSSPSAQASHDGTEL